MSLLQPKWSNAGAGTYAKEVPTGVINGTNKDFVVTNTPKTNSLIVYLDKILETAYTFNVGTKTITFTTAPGVGQDVYVTYNY